MERILIIDDDKMNMKITQFILDKAGYEVTLAESAFVGIHLLMEHKFDLLLLDIKKPDMDGIEALKYIRSIPEVANTKVVFLTASNSRDDLTDAVHLGASRFVQKPCLPDELLAVVEEAFEEKDNDTLLLIVDDDMLSRKVTLRVFESLYRVKCVSSGEEAIEFCKQTVPSLILMDLYMPNMDGLAAFQHIKAMDSCRHVPIMFMTVDHNTEVEQKLFQAGAVDFVRKPFIADVIKERARRVLELEQLQRFLYEEVDRRTFELHESMLKVKRLTEQVICALGSAIDAKDAYTNGHSGRVAEYSKEIARRAGKDENEIEKIYYAALLHDVGKIGVAREILNKPGKLTEEEFAIIKQHPSIGHKILDSISELPSLSIAARWHHERYDGGGYPDGLAGEDIPEIARIICVADSYDAMTSTRSYRGVVSQEKVRSEIERGRGTQFDPQFADIMLQMIDEDTDFSMQENGSVPSCSQAHSQGFFLADPR